MSKLHDPIRHKDLVHTPEEEVRQNLVQWLIQYKQVPANWIQLEVPLAQFRKGLKGRVDVVVHHPQNLWGKSTRPWLLVECKREGDCDWQRLEVQVNRYLRTIWPQYLLLEIGSERRIFALSEPGSPVQLLADLPLFGIPL